jgi:hypothetical protein
LEKSFTPLDHVFLVIQCGNEDAIRLVLAPRETPE